MVLGVVKFFSKKGIDFVEKSGIIETQSNRVDSTFSRIGIYSKENEKEQSVGGFLVKITYVMLCIAVAGAGCSDLLCGQVYNWWLFMWTVVGIFCRGAGFLMAAGIAFVPAFFLFRFRMMGAGDGKLMMLIAGYLGLEAGMQAIWVGFIIGAIWSLCRLWHDKSFLARLNYLSAYFLRIFQEKRVIAYDDLHEERNEEERHGEKEDREERETEKDRRCENRHRIPLAACLAVGVVWSVWMNF